MATEHANISVQDVADRLEVHRTTITRWSHDLALPRYRDLREWADMTGVSYEWLAEAMPGYQPPPPEPPTRNPHRKTTEPQHTSRRRRKPPTRCYAENIDELLVASCASWE